MALTIVMYHYVRPLSRSRYPGIKGLEVSAFKEQLEYLARHYTPVTMQTVVAAVRGETPLPRNAVLLTFDDGYRDHHDFVLPLLVERELEGSFFVPAAPVVSGCVLDVNKIHFILASVPDTARVVSEMERMVDEARERLRLPATAELRASCHVATRFDSADVAYVKRLLQRVLPGSLRSAIAAALFARFVSTDEAAFAAELYLSRADIGRMIQAGMHVGGHGDQHRWLASMPANEQSEDIESSLAFLESVSATEDAFTFCYPYGDYNADTLRILAGLNCAAAFTTRVDLARVPGAHALELPRLDTNDLPTEAQAPVSVWTRRIGASE